MARQYIVGIDLGTTNTVVAYAPIDAQADGRAAIILFEIEQLVAPGQLAALPLLPSVRYHPLEAELPAADIRLPWPQDHAQTQPVVIGQLARRLGAQVPGRMVASAKSWLSHTGVDRLAPILPWGAAPDVAKVSPVAASASYLAYLRSAWNSKFPDTPLEQQELVLTVPASFDEGARALTLSAARQAGLHQLRLLEEPQAVFYDWLFRHRGELAGELAHTRMVLVCDVGGGTTDLSLIKVDLHDGQPQLTRIGVGNHVMLGGDNMDLALAHVTEAKMAQMAGADQPRAHLSASALSQLMERCRAAKEQLLAADAPEQAQVTLLGSGSRMIGGMRSVALTKEEVGSIIVDGFFPKVAATDPVQQGRAGIVEFGLPYARDPAVTRHIADFLQQHASALQAAQDDGTAMPDTLLLNGGVFRADALVERLQETLGSWRGAPLRLLHNDNPDVAVARGAVAYALSLQGQAPRIDAGAARSYFLVLDEAGTGPKRGICILPRGSETGREILLKDRSFALRLGQPVRFHVMTSNADGADAPPAAGELVDLDDPKYVRLPPIATVLHADDGKLKPAGGKQETTVQLATALTEVGTLEMHCVHLTDAGQRWLLEFDLRHDNAAAGNDKADGAPSPQLTAAIDKIDRIFGKSGQQVTAKEVKQLRAQLEQLLGEREQWHTPLLRQLFDALWQRARGRRRSPEHERVWLNLAGYCLRPGFGYALDEWRLEQLWTLFEAGVRHADDKQARAEWWTLWRRVAGGLGATEQLRLLDDFAFNLQTNKEGGEASPTVVAGSDDDMLRLGASLERIPVDYKAEIGGWLLERIQAAPATPGKDATGASRYLWALGRIGARQPFHGSMHDVVPTEVVEGWLDAILALDWKRVEPAAFAAVHLARMTDDRSRDLPLALRERIVQRLVAINAPPATITMVQQVVQLDQATERWILGESLPPGLKLIA
ncbi:Hsp70 family protein [Massilia antarctica]|uniref:Hsp70 family protein n=1 Tax=Massilia antarctica TaxID=2765360 RepID=UPI0006BB8C1F|nr:Hsp70 family protein [Massilia sp. H27-R4]MCY0916131.1 hsp70 family protein [Massilia sp. H27-R4]CUI05970.1 Chaperone protein DnaK [Janthinobacterium sp. CG23_2]CUU29756.1 Chaperone protein DnaK [Janthinobacterium sp. CG23_2]